MAVGSFDNSKRVALEAAHSKAEMFFHSTSSWRTQSSYSFHEGISIFQIIAHSDYYIIFGGVYPFQKADLSTDNHPTDVIAKFNPKLNQWKPMGKLLNYRYGFGLIEVDKKFLVMGGEGDMQTEVCEIKGETVACTSREPTLTQFRYYPEMMVVSSDFVDNC